MPFFSNTTTAQTIRRVYELLVGQGILIFPCVSKLSQCREHSQTSPERNIETEENGPCREMAVNGGWNVLNKIIKRPLNLSGPVFYNIVTKVKGK